MADNPVTPVTDLVHTAVDTANDAASGATKVLAASAIGTIQLGRNLLDSLESLAHLGIDVVHDPLDVVLAKLQAHVEELAK